MTHFAARAKERGLDDIDQDALHKDLRIALADPIRWHEYVEPVFALEGGAYLWRFRAKPDTFHYVVARNGGPITILTEAMMRRYRDVRKGKKFQKLWDPKA